MTPLFTQYWWIFLLRGLFAIILGIIALLIPGVTFTTLVIFLGAYMLVDGIFSVITAISGRKTMEYWGWVLTIGILSILAGIVTFMNPFVTGAALLYLVAFWAIVVGLLEIVVSIRLRKVITGEGWYILAGILGIAFGILIILNPIAGAITITLIFGFYALIFGFILLSFAMRLRRRHKEATQKHYPSATR
ncbi:HdeD family acid-resistance protein [Paraflavitalea soli]|uniref:HdeD family acid-resistance protein n=1 Tax=Paraflavitalea soli TaxID=2315862 RepID=A0A3B7MF99_9BACT|nr:HdeD family acid-resistance protein [Paraflavitalea soli]AXY73008.1 HdeD family acid-resistance protein [Paraflavitalea soli]